MSKFKFIQNASSFNPPNAYVGHIKSIEGKEQLLREFYSVFHLPTYFGFNWDALLDVLCDLNWIKHKTVVIIHDDFPKLSEKDSNIYLSILLESILAWENFKGINKNHTLEVIFDYKYKSVLDKKDI